jgi:hypothetical protein
MKSIILTGKRNIDKINNVEKPKRQVINKYTFSQEYYNNHTEQKNLLNKLLLQDDTCISDCDQLNKILKEKRNSYYNQDIQKKIYNDKKFILLDEIIELLVVSKLKCNYCRENCFVIYEEVLFNKQWTLDRINNDLGHHKDNVVISCLKCNLQRKTMDYERFEWGKKLKIKKSLT